jgi:16S rRNA (guanine966-N2)-methyltransferase
MAELRIVGGELGGRRLKVPRGARLRPTTERVREALFSILGDLSGLRVLDLFCGTGALGIEALSRGASGATLVDTDVRVARGNVEALGLSDRARVVRSDVVRFLRRAELGGFDLVLCDPPYRLADRLGADLGPLIDGCLATGGRAVIESAAESPLELGLPLLDERSYGDTLLRIHRAEARR